MKFSDKKFAIGVAAILVAAIVLLIVTIYKNRRIIYDEMKKTTTSSYFTISELCESNTAQKQGINNTPSEMAKSNLQLLITECLNPIREIYGKPIIISSGYRSSALNKAVGGASNSQHLTGQAADMVPANGGSLNEIFKAAVSFGKYDQLIYEQNSKGSKWVHVSYDANRNRGQILSYKNGIYTDITKNWNNVVA